MTDKEKAMITPDMKISELLENYPELEEALVEAVPAYEKLINPLLRNTVARITSLRQLAEIGKVDLGELINQLRQQAGISEQFETDEELAKDNSGKPKWVDESKIVKKLDARAMLAEGGHPVGVVLEELQDLKGDEIYMLITPFLPQPLLDRVKEEGFKVWSETVGKEYRSYFVRNNGN